MSSLYADVIIDIAAGNLDRAFTYRVPARLQEGITAGSQVQVPFGRGDRRTNGYVIGLTDQPSCDPALVKDVLAVADGGMAIEGQLIRLAGQIKSIYGGTMQQALKTVLPVRRQVVSKQKKRYHLTQDSAFVQQYLQRIRGDGRCRARMAAVVRLADADTAESMTKEELGTRLQMSESVFRTLLRDHILTEAEAPMRIPFTLSEEAARTVTLSDAQRRITEAIRLDSHHRTHLIFGVTGSGKTEIYMELTAQALADGRQVIVLIPEIALSMQTVSRFYARFGGRVSVMNSSLSDSEKYEQYMHAKEGRTDIVIGPRSALFMPFDRLGLIIMDEEHDGAYKSEHTPRYHARTVAALRAKEAGAILVLGSATPSLESYTRALDGRYGLHRLQTRAVRNAALPQVEVCDLRDEFRMKNKRILSRRLGQLMEETLQRNEQILLFLNRRGYAGFVSCRSCGYVFKCRHCDVSMTAHAGGILKCHYCGAVVKQPRVCPVCGSPYVAAFGTGTQKVEQMVRTQFPQAHVLRLDRDAAAGKGSMDAILESFRRHEADILIGTQMIVKGHDFPDVTLVGVLAADLSMFSGDYMAAERTFALLTQAAGRAGRDEKPGRVVIQTYQPDHYSIQCAREQDYEAFYRQEMAYRRILSYPPAAQLMAVLVTGRNEEKAKTYAGQLSQDVLHYIKDSGTEAVLIGPTDAAVAKGKDIYRKVFYIKDRSFSHLIQIREFMEEHWKNSLFAREVLVQFDVNPMTMY